MGHFKMGHMYHLHNIIQPSDQVGWSRGYTMCGARIICYKCLSVTIFNLKNEEDPGEIFSLRKSRMERLIVVE